MDIIPRVADYPIMVPDGIDYSNEHAFESEHDPKPGGMSDGIGILHRVRGNNLVSDLISRDTATFATTVVSPTCAYRKIMIAEGRPREISGGGVELEQHIDIAERELSRPIWFQPTVIATKPINSLMVKGTHGLHEIWSGAAITFPVAAVIASQPFQSTRSVFESILKVQKANDSELRPGSFEVKDSLDEGFHFLIRVEPELYGALRQPACFQHQKSILIMALAQGLEILKREYADPDQWRNHENLFRLRQMLKDRGLPTWEDRDDFRPNQVVAEFHPHILKMAGGDDDDE